MLNISNSTKNDLLFGGTIPADFLELKQTVDAHVEEANIGGGDLVEGALVSNKS
jgi:hypothetical protein